MQAAAVEIESILKNDTWELVDRPEDRNTIGSRFVLRDKFGSDGNLNRRKARIVARGFSQRPGVHFDETFAPVARLSSIRLAIAFAAQQGMIIRQFDMATAYLNGSIEEEIYMEPPKFLENSLKYIIQTKRNLKLVSKAEEMLNKPQETKFARLKGHFTASVKQVGAGINAPTGS